MGNLQKSVSPCCGANNTPTDVQNEVNTEQKPKKRKSNKKKEKKNKKKSTPKPQKKKNQSQSVQSIPSQSYDNPDPPIPQPQPDNPDPPKSQKPPVTYKKMTIVIDKVDEYGQITQTQTLDAVQQLYEDPIEEEEEEDDDYEITNDEYIEIFVNALKDRVNYDNNNDIITKQDTLIMNTDIDTSKYNDEQLIMALIVALNQKHNIPSSDINKAINNVSELLNKQNIDLKINNNLIDPFKALYDTFNEFNNNWDHWSDNEKKDNAKPLINDINIQIYPMLNNLTDIDNNNNDDVKLDDNQPILIDIDWSQYNSLEKVMYIMKFFDFCETWFKAHPIDGDELVDYDQKQ